MTTPKNHGMPWTHKEDWQVVEFFVIGRSTEFIAQAMGRTETAIIARLANEHRLLMSDSSQYGTYTPRFRIHSNPAYIARTLASRYDKIAEVNKLSIDPCVHKGSYWNASGLIRTSSPVRKEWLQAQYIDVLINDGEYMRKARMLATSPDPFKALTIDYVHAIYSKYGLEFKITADEAKYIADEVIDYINDYDPPTEEAPQMSDKIIVETKHFLNNVEIKTLNDAQLIDAIKTVEKEIDTLEAVKTKSKKITAKVEECKVTLAAIVAHLDAR